MNNLDQLTEMALTELRTLRLEALTKARVEEHGIVNNKFSIGDRVRISNFPNEIHEVLNIRQLAHDQQPHYCLEEPLIWLAESSLEAAIAKSNEVTA
jgi:hypothetical protein